MMGVVGGGGGGVEEGGGGSHNKESWSWRQDVRDRFGLAVRR